MEIFGGCQTSRCSLHAGFQPVGARCLGRAALSNDRHDFGAAGDEYMYEA